jgi:hypothetical protein
MSLPLKRFLALESPHSTSLKRGVNDRAAKIPKQRKVQTLPGNENGAER